MERGQFADAEKLLRRALELNRGEAEVLSHLAWAVWNSGSGGRDAARAEAESLMATSLEMLPKQPRAYVFKGEMALQDGRYTEAATFFRKALEWRPKDVEAQRGMRLAEKRLEKEGAQKASGSVGAKLKSLLGRGGKE
jgi:Flp pilus assembly protein TadD